MCLRGFSATWDSRLTPRSCLVKIDQEWTKRQIERSSEPQDIDLAPFVEIGGMAMLTHYSGGIAKFASKVCRGAICFGDNSKITKRLLMIRYIHQENPCEFTTERGR